MKEDPELVRDAGANFRSTEFHPDEENVTVTTHWKAEGLLKYSDERWIRKKFIKGGGQGSVFLECLHDDESKQRAVKRIDISDGDIKRKYYVRELETLAKFSQEGFRRWFVRAYGWYETEKYLYIPMEYYPLGDLKNYINKRGPIPENEAKQIAWQIAHALQIMHKEKFAHRDIKAENILIARHSASDWQVKVADMGISKRISELDGDTTSINYSRPYRAPELIYLSEETKLEAQKADPNPIDIWCLGETLFFMLTKEHTFTGTQRDNICKRFGNGRIPFPTEKLFQQGVSSDTIDLITMLMQPVPGDRLSPFAAKIWLEGGQDGGRLALQSKLKPQKFHVFSELGAKFDHTKLFEIYDAGLHPSRPSPKPSPRFASFSNLSPVGNWNNSFVPGPTTFPAAHNMIPSWNQSDDATAATMLENLPAQPEEDMASWTRTEMSNPQPQNPQPLEPADPYYQSFDHRQSSESSSSSSSLRTGGPLFQEDDNGFYANPTQTQSVGNTTGFFLPHPNGDTTFVLNTDPRVKRLTSVGWSLEDAQIALLETWGNSEQALQRLMQRQGRRKNSIDSGSSNSNPAFIFDHFLAAGWPEADILRAFEAGGRSRDEIAQQLRERSQRAISNPQQSPTMQFIDPNDIMDPYLSLEPNPPSHMLQHGQLPRSRSDNNLASYSNIQFPPGDWRIPPTNLQRLDTQMAQFIVANDPGIQELIDGSSYSVEHVQEALERAGGNVKTAGDLLRLWESLGWGQNHVSPLNPINHQVGNEGPSRSMEDLRRSWNTSPDEMRGGSNNSVYPQRPTPSILFNNSPHEAQAQFLGQAIGGMSLQDDSNHDFRHSQGDHQNHHRQEYYTNDEAPTQPQPYHPGPSMPPALPPRGPQDMTGQQSLSSQAVSPEFFEQSLQQRVNLQQRLFSPPLHSTTQQPEPLPRQDVDPRLEKPSQVMPPQYRQQFHHPGQQQPQIPHSKMLPMQNTYGQPFYQSPTINGAAMSQTQSGNDSIPYMYFAKQPQQQQHHRTMHQGPYHPGMSQDRSLDPNQKGQGKLSRALRTIFP